MNITKILSVILVSLIIITGCSKKEINNETQKVIPVEVSIVKKSSIDRDIELVGTLAAWKEANLGAQTSEGFKKFMLKKAQE